MTSKEEHANHDRQSVHMLQNKGKKKDKATNSLLIRSLLP